MSDTNRDAESRIEIGEQVAILAAIRRGEAAADTGNVVPHDEVRRRSVSWTARHGAPRHPSTL